MENHGTKRIVTGSTAVWHKDNLLWNTAFIEPMHYDKPNITYFLLCLRWQQSYHHENSSFQCIVSFVLGVIFTLQSLTSMYFGGTAHWSYRYAWIIYCYFNITKTWTSIWEELFPWIYVYHYVKVKSVLKILNGSEISTWRGIAILSGCSLSTFRRKTSLYLPCIESKKLRRTVGHGWILVAWALYCEWKPGQSGFSSSITTSVRILSGKAIWMRWIQVDLFISWQFNIVLSLKVLPC